MADNKYSIDDFEDGQDYQIEDFQDTDAVGETAPPATSPPLIVIRLLL